MAKFDYLNLNSLNKEFPNVKPIEPDYSLIIYAYHMAKNTQFITDGEFYVGMLKYILDGRIQEYEKEYLKLYDLYYYMYQFVDIKD